MPPSRAYNRPQSAAVTSRRGDMLSAASSSLTRVASLGEDPIHLTQPSSALDKSGTPKRAGEREAAQKRNAHIDRLPMPRWPIEGAAAAAGKAQAIGEIQADYRMHLDRIRSIKPGIDNTPPRSCTKTKVRMEGRRKARAQTSDRIERENHQLMQSLCRVLDEPSRFCSLDEGTERGRLHKRKVSVEQAGWPPVPQTQTQTPQPAHARDSSLTATPLASCARRRGKSRCDESTRRTRGCSVRSCTAPRSSNSTSSTGSGRPRSAISTPAQRCRGPSGTCPTCPLDRESSFPSHPRHQSPNHAPGPPPARARRQHLWSREPPWSRRRHRRRYRRPQSRCLRPRRRAADGRGGARGRPGRPPRAGKQGTPPSIM